MNDYQRFVPSRVEGLRGVTEVIVRPDRLELQSVSRWVCFRLSGIARWARPARLRRLLASLGFQFRPVRVGDRSWVQSPPDRSFRFYTAPPVVIYMPVDEPQMHGGSCFARVQEVLATGGFNTGDTS
jgi:hypothetical protein